MYWQEWLMDKTQFLACVLPYNLTLREWHGINWKKEQYKAWMLPHLNIYFFQFLYIIMYTNRILSRYLQGAWTLFRNNNIIASHIHRPTWILIFLCRICVKSQAVETQGRKDKEKYSRDTHNKWKQERVLTMMLSTRQSDHLSIWGDFQTIHASVVRANDRVNQDILLFYMICNLPESDPFRLK